MGYLQAGVQGDAELGSHNEDLAKSLIQMLHDPDTGVASSAAGALMRSIRHAWCSSALNASLLTLQQVMLQGGHVRSPAAHTAP